MRVEVNEKKDIERERNIKENEYSKRKQKDLLKENKRGDKKRDRRMNGRKGE